MPKSAAPRRHTETLTRNTRATGSAKTQQNGYPSRHTPISDSNTPMGTDARPHNSPYSTTTPFLPLNRFPPLLQNINKIATPARPPQHVRNSTVTTAKD